MTVKLTHLPERVKVGPYWYAVESWDPRDASSDLKYGRVNHVLKRIYVDESHGRLQAVETLLHELFHAVWTVAGLEDGAQEEAVVHSITTFTIMVMQDNPGLFGFIEDGAND